MGVFKLGPIITDITGSIGGTTFVRGKQSMYMQNKSRGASNSRLFQNKRLSEIGSIFRKWNTLTSLHRADWNLIALNYTFPDKFGVMRNLTGRQLFTKLNVQLLPVKSFILAADQVSSVVQTVTIDNFLITTSLGSAEIQYSTGANENFIICQLEVTRQNLHSPIFTRRKVSAFSLVSTAGGFDVLAALLEQFPYVDSSYNVRAFLTVINESGFKGVTVYQDAVWVE